MHSKVKETFELTGFIEIIDKGVIRRFGKKYPRLNLPLFIITCVYGHQQGTTIFNKFMIHIYYVTNMDHESGQKILDAILQFFDHYTNNPDYEITFTIEFQNEMNDLKNFAMKQFPLEICNKMYKCISTSKVESKFSTRLFFTPKNRNYPTTFATRCRLVDLKWDEDHIAEKVLTYYGNFFLIILRNVQKRFEVILKKIEEKIGLLVLQKSF